MYALVHLEGRYVGAFLVLFVCSIIAVSLEIRNVFNRELFTTTVILASSTLLLSPVLTTYSQSIPEREERQTKKPLLQRNSIGWAFNPETGLAGSAPLLPIWRWIDLHAWRLRQR